MKKISTLIVALMAVIGVSAQTFKVAGESYTAGTVVYSDNNVEVTVATGDVTVGTNANAEGEAAPVVFGDFSFDKYFNLRVEDAPSAAEPTGTVREGSAALVVKALTKTDITIYYRRGATKSVDVYDQTSNGSASITENAIEDGDNMQVAGLLQMQEGHTYTVYTRGGTSRVYGFNTSEGTYTKPTLRYYANLGAATAEVDGTTYSAMKYEDDALVVLTGNDTKKYSAGKDITIEGKKYKGTKVSNGAANTFFAPAGKKVYSVTIYAYKNSASGTRTTFWKEVGATTVTAEDLAEDDARIITTADGAAPHAQTFAFPDGAESFVFTNTGEQVVFVLDISYDAATAIQTVKSTDAAAGVKKVVENGQFIIVKGGKKYNAAGAQLK